MHKSRTFVVVGFLCIQFAAFILSNILTTIIFSNLVSVEQSEYHTAMRLTALELMQRTELSPEEIAKVLSTSSYKIEISDEFSTLRAVQQQRLLDGFSVVIGKHFSTITYFLLQDTLVKIGVYRPDIQFALVASRSFLSSVIMFIIMMLTIFFFSKALVRPIVDITAATRRVAGGDLDVSVKVPKIYSRHANEIVELAENFNRMTRELKAIEYLRRDFTSNVSHEIKTPLATISGYARLLQMDALPDDERKEYAAGIAEASMHLSHMSDNLLKLTRLESQQISLPAKPYHLDEQLRRIAGSLYPTIEKKKLRLDVDLQDHVIIHGDEELLSQVWLNLIGNAMKFTPENGQIGISLATQGHAACVIISDSGVGMDAEVQSRIFEKFYQADKSRHMGGNGLGLPLVKRIIDISGGKISVISAPGAGSCFTVRLPMEKF